MSGVIDTITVTPDHGKRVSHRYGRIPTFFPPVCSLSVGPIFSWRSGGNCLDWYNDDICCNSRDERSKLEVRYRVERVIGVCSITSGVTKEVEALGDHPR